ncbi:HpcH/HpaI aldolase/citrate lyase family protein [Oceanobacillus senegalensis]|uniref:HpcH/HpaI aldolase/citrate lyase family protein n=1 Tax=Oceanobacillus senegalensis TaxID=1936063 RepID=UPI000A3141DD|nr:CoA ester lyase [Oceanobacillus senegalensis]
MKRYRTLLFVPGIKKKWFENIPSYNADGIILDLEDSVPANLKEEARQYVSEAIPNLSSKGVDVFVRINKGAEEFDKEDIHSIVMDGLQGIVLPKIDGPDEIEQLSKHIKELEEKQGLAIGGIGLLPILETAKSMQLSYEIASCERVLGIAGLSAKNGDVARSLGYQWTSEGLETLYMRSKVVMSARAAGVSPIGGLWQDVHNLEGLRKSSEFNRQLGFVGELVLHPSNVSIVNDIYSPSKEEIDYYEGLVEAFKNAERNGETAIMYKGEHIDYAHVKTAKKVLETVKNMNIIQ